MGCFNKKLNLNNGSVKLKMQIMTGEGQSLLLILIV